MHVTTLMKKVALGVASVALASTCLAASVVVLPVGTVYAHEPLLGLQLKADEDVVGPGGRVNLHLMYHNKRKQHYTSVVIKVIVPSGLEVDPNHLGGAAWNAQNRTLEWSMVDVNPDTARLLDFRLLIKDTTPVNTVYQLKATAEDNCEEQNETPSISVRVGTQVHQPFFVGFPDGEFKPTTNFTRAEAAAVVARVKGIVAPAAPKTYPDVPDDHWASKYIASVTNAGFMTGYPDGTFHPNDPITRAELTLLVLGMRDIKPVPVDGFADTTTHWAKDYIGTAKQLKIVAGVGGNYFYPDTAIERQAAARMVSVGLLRGPLHDGQTKVVQHFPDVPPSLWSFGWVEETAIYAHESVNYGEGWEELIKYLPDQTNPM